MIRFYYTDPLAAAWMAKYFGMRFIRADLLKWETRLWVAEDVEQARHNGKYYIYPDSLRLLEPEVGDCLCFPAAVEPYEQCREDEADLSKLHRSFARYKIATGDCRII